jgi:hypothetical protein
MIPHKYDRYFIGAQRHAELLKGFMTCQGKYNVVAIEKEESVANIQYFFGWVTLFDSPPATVLCTHIVNEEPIGFLHLPVESARDLWNYLIGKGYIPL